MKYDNKALSVLLIAPSGPGEKGGMEQLVTASRSKVC